MRWVQQMVSNFLDKLSNAEVPTDSVFSHKAYWFTTWETHRQTHLSLKDPISSQTTRDCIQWNYCSKLYAFQSAWQLHTRIIEEERRIERTPKLQESIRSFCVIQQCPLWFRWSSISWIEWLKWISAIHIVATLNEAHDNLLQLLTTKKHEKSPACLYSSWIS